MYSLNSPAMPLNVNCDLSLTRRDTTSTFASNPQPATPSEERLTQHDVRLSVVLGPLPATGSRSRGPLTLSLVLFGLGGAMLLVARKPRVPS